MSTFSIRRLDINQHHSVDTKVYATIEADTVDYSGGDNVVVAVFRRANATNVASSAAKPIVALATLIPGMIVQKESSSSVDDVRTK